jgi:hypothetical protein
MGAELFYEDRQTDEYDKANSRKVANAPKKPTRREK